MFILATAIKQAVYSVWFATKILLKRNSREWRKRFQHKIPKLLHKVPLKNTTEKNSTFGYVFKRKLHQ